MLKTRVNFDEILKHNIKERLINVPMKKYNFNSSVNCSRFFFKDGKSL